jgi:hypothetical protein
MEGCLLGVPDEPLAGSGVETSVFVAAAASGILLFSTRAYVAPLTITAIAATNPVKRVLRLSELTVLSSADVGLPAFGCDQGIVLSVRDLLNAQVFRINRTSNSTEPRRRQDPTYQGSAHKQDARRASRQVDDFSRGDRRKCFRISNGKSKRHKARRPKAQASTASPMTAKPQPLGSFSS